MDGFYTKILLIDDLGVPTFQETSIFILKSRSFEHCFFKIFALNFRVVLQFETHPCRMDCCSGMRIVNPHFLEV